MAKQLQEVYTKASGHDLFEEDAEFKVRYRLNQTGNIMYQTSSKVPQERTKRLFDAVSVIFTQMTQAMVKEDKSLFDYWAWNKLIRETGFFVEAQQLINEYSVSTASGKIDLQIVNNLIPGLDPKSMSMNILKGVVGAIAHKMASEGYHRSESKDRVELGHLLFICEEIMGAPSVSVRLFKVDQETVIRNKEYICWSSKETSMKMKQQAATFLFVDPEAIAQHAGTFKHPKAFKTQVRKFRKYISGKDPGPDDEDQSDAEDDGHEEDEHKDDDSDEVV